MNVPAPAPRVHDAELLVREVVREESLCTLLLEPPEPGMAVAAGQYAMLKSLAPGAPLLPRPISLIPDPAGLRLAFNIVAAGTQALAGVKAGERVLFVGPLGNVFDPPDAPILIVADAPHVGTMLALAVERAGRGDTVLYLADPARAHPSDASLVAAFRALDLTLLVRPPAAVAEVLSSGGFDYVAAGADDAAMAAVQREAARLGMRGEAAMQAAMACGLGVCQVCVHAGHGDRPFLVCDGPVFPLEQPVFAQGEAR